MAKKYLARYVARVYFDIAVEMPDDEATPTKIDIEEYIPEGAIDNALPNNIEFDDIEIWDIEEVTDED